MGKNDIECFRSLGVVSALRGLDSTGMIMARKHKKNWHYDFAKEATDPINFLHYNKHIKNLLFDTKNIFALLGHTRLATVGDITKANAHPFRIGHIVGMHNGTIRGFGNKDKTDSEELYEKIANDGVEKVVDSLPFDAAYALVWVDTRKDTVNFLRNNNRPLWSMSSKCGKTLMYASEREFLDLINVYSTTIFGDPLPIKPDVWFSYNLHTMELQQKEVKRKLPTFFTRPPATVPAVGSAVVGPIPPRVPASTAGSYELIAKENAPAPVIVHETDREKFDPACEVFDQVPHTGYPLRAHFRHPDLPTQIFKVLRFNDFNMNFRAPAEILPSLNEGCVISGIRAKLEDEVMWIGPGQYVMPWFRDDVFVKECLQVYDRKYPVLGRACYATAMSLKRHIDNLKTRGVECG